MPTLYAPDPAATDAIGAALAQCVEPGETLLLTGDLGAGKSALARAFIRARLGEPALDVPSPSFALVQPYRGIVHADLYRLSQGNEIDELGLDAEDDAIVLVEWPERAPELFDRAGLSIALSMLAGAQGRQIVVTARGGRNIGPVEKALAPWMSADQG